MNKDKKNRYLWIAGTVILLIFVWFYSTKNSFTTLENAINTSWVGVEVQLNRQFRLLPQFKKTQAALTLDSGDLFVSLEQLEKQLNNTQSINDKVVIANDFNRKVHQLLAEAAQKNNSGKNSDYMDFVDEFKNSEARFEVAKRRYNENIDVFNQKIINPPSSLVAKILKLPAYENLSKSQVE